ncbi:MAG: 4-(cytidine 5'-diphospho)-2-C-methyl-D-erythritol kinase [Pirellulales bacterium]|nr:4-(cytidine 5'-diphospho)-2-C-methyl-D-erythritol kinase [Pirellulales bacterium]
MLLWRTATQVVVEAPAKLNLFFEVLGKRGDGFHEIETLMAPIGLWDTLYFEEDRSGQIRLDCRQAIRGLPGEPIDPPDTQLGCVPEGAGNLVFRAVELLRQRAGVRRGAALRLVKRIPVAAGLGGGSTDAAAALVAANEGWRLGWSRRALADLAAELGSDVPFFLSGGPAVCRGRGERIEPLEPCRAFDFVVVRPAVGLSTANVYKACQPAGKPRSMVAILDAISKGNAARVGRLLFNRLEPAAVALCGELARLRENMARQDFLGYGMSGSGTCYFGLCRHTRHARRVAGRLQATGVGTVFAVRGSR